MFCEFDQDEASWSWIYYSGPSPYPYLLGVGSRYHPFSLCFVGLDLNDAPHYFKTEE
jgi:hypothetical protein